MQTSDFVIITLKVIKYLQLGILSLSVRSDNTGRFGMNLFYAAANLVHLRGRRFCPTKR
jgi:hypothetical protein